MNGYNDSDYFRPKNYITYLISKSMQKGIGKRIGELYSKIKKITLISAIIRVSAIAISLLEKSAILLLMFTALLLIFPLILSGAAIYALISMVKYHLLHREISKWLITGKKITVFITKRRVFSKQTNYMFTRQAQIESQEYDHPVIIVCKDPFIAAKWCSLNLLAIKTDYFFFLKHRYFEKSGKNITYIVL